MIAATEFFGLDLGPLPYESMRSVRSRFAWRNGISHGNLKRLFNNTLMLAMRNNTLVGNPTDANALEILTGWKTEINESVERKFYHKCATTPIDYLERPFRYCPLCLEDCYHSYLFQWSRLRICPLHGCELRTKCCSCGVQFEDTRMSEAIGRLGYKCDACGHAIAGAEPDLTRHLEFRESAAWLMARFHPHAKQIDDLYAVSRPIQMSSEALLAQSVNPDTMWCNREAFLLSAELLLTIRQHNARLTEKFGITFIRWHIYMEENFVKPLWPQLQQKTWRERTLALRPVYLATRRLLERWIFKGRAADEEEPRIRLRFMNDGSDDIARNWDPLELAYGLFRFGMERFGFPEEGKMVDQGLVQLRDAPSTIHDWEYCGRCPRVAFRAWLLAAYAILVSFVKRHPEMNVDRILESQNFPHSLVPTFYEDKADKKDLVGGVFFPTIEGMPLDPFLHRIAAAP